MKLILGFAADDDQSDADALIWNRISFQMVDFAHSPKDVFDNQVRAMANKMWYEYVSPFLAVEGR